MKSVIFMLIMATAATTNAAEVCTIYLQGQTDTDALGVERVAYRAVARDCVASTVPTPQFFWVVENVPSLKGEKFQTFDSLEQAVHDVIYGN